MQENSTIRPWPGKVDLQFIIKEKHEGEVIFHCSLPKFSLFETTVLKQNYQKVISLAKGVK